MSLFNLITTITLLVAILLIMVILLQEPKDSLTSYGGSSAPVERIGINQKANFLEKATWTLASIFLLLTLLASICLKYTPKNQSSSPNLMKVQTDKNKANSANVDNIATKPDTSVNSSAQNK